MPSSRFYPVWSGFTGFSFSTDPIDEHSDDARPRSVDWFTAIGFVDRQAHSEPAQVNVGFAEFTGEFLKEKLPTVTRR